MDSPSETTAWCGQESSLEYVLSRKSGVQESVIYNTELFDESSCLKWFFSGKKVKEFLKNQNSRLIVKYKMFGHQKSNEVPYKNICRLVEFVFVCQAPVLHF